MIAANATVDYASPVVGLLGLPEADCFGEKGSRIKSSHYFRDYCYLCNEPIRVPRRLLRHHNACSVCEPRYRGKPGVNDIERNFWIEQYQEQEIESND